MTALWRRLLRETVWSVGLARVTEDELLELLLGQRALGELDLRWVTRRGHSFVADPFVFRHGDDLCLAYEDFRVLDGRGRITVRRVADDLTLGPDVVAEIVEPHHLAFPSPTLIGDRVHLVPDSATKEVVAYPLDGGGPVRVDGPTRLPCTDPLLVRDDAGDGAVLLATDRDQQLWAYTVRPADDTRWDVTARGAVPGAGRLAGGLVTARGRTFRLQQNQSDGYGTAIDVFEIDPAGGDHAGTHRTTITRPDSRGGWWDGTHHLSFADGVLAVDVRHRRYTPLAAPLKVWYRLRSA